MAVPISDDEDVSSGCPLQVSDKPFRDCCVLILPIGSFRGSARRSIVSKHICDRGGSYLNEASAVSHVLVAKDTAEKLRAGDASTAQTLSNKIASLIPEPRWIISESWYEATLQRRQRAPEQDHQLTPGNATDSNVSAVSVTVSPEKVVIAMRDSGTRNTCLKVVGSIANSPQTRNRSRSRELRSPSSVWDSPGSALPGNSAASPISDPVLRRKAQRMRERFACQQSTQDAPQNAMDPNIALAKVFEDMAAAVLSATSSKSDEFRARQYRRTSQIIRGWNVAVESGADLKPLRDRLGPRTWAKVEEWLQTGGIAKAQVLAQDDRVKEIRDLCLIWGVGQTTAAQWRSMGLRNIADVRKRTQENSGFLNRVQTIGVDLFEDFQQRIPREEATAIFERVADEARVVFRDPRLDVQCCGSYRRGRASCGDVDVLICGRVSGPECKDYMTQLVASLARGGFIVRWVPNDGLSSDSYDNSPGDAEKQSATFLGVCQLRPELPHRRIDIKVWPSESYAFALLHFTGSGHFNRSMRLFANKLGYTLSDHGLRKCHRIRREKVWQGPTVACYTEEDIFRALGLEYVPPEKREVATASLDTFATNASQSSRAAKHSSGVTAVVDIESDSSAAQQQTRCESVASTCSDCESDVSVGCKPTVTGATNSGV